MKTKLMAWATGTVLGIAALGGPALAQTTVGSTGARAETKESRAVRSQAEAENKAAQAPCNSRKGADQKTCLEEVRAQQQKAQRGPAGSKTGAARTPRSPDPLPAVQTQSSAVSATGIAPSTTGPDPTPGTPAIPRK